MCTYLNVIHCGPRLWALPSVPIMIFLKQVFAVSLHYTLDIDECFGIETTWGNNAFHHCIVRTIKWNDHYTHSSSISLTKTLLQLLDNSFSKCICLKAGQIALTLLFPPRGHGGKTVYCFLYLWTATLWQIPTLRITCGTCGCLCLY